MSWMSGGYAVEDPVLVQVFEALEHLSEDVDDVFLGDGDLGVVDDFGEVAAHVVHRHVDVALLDEDVLELRQHSLPPLCARDAPPAGS